tara:strand:+ start:487 stop:1056 length:570 start_codon:yes stop_codon:yes gene_type:complete
MEYSLRQAALEDAETLAALGRRTFYQTFVDFYSKATMERYLSDAFDLGRVARELACPQSRFWLLEDIGHSETGAAGKEREGVAKGPVAVGYLKLNWGEAQTDLSEHDGLEIERIYLLAEVQGRGLGRVLYDKAIGEAQEQGKDFVWLGVWENNHPAIAFYRSRGFVEVGTHSFQMGDVVDRDLIMRRDL